MPEIEHLVCTTCKQKMGPLAHYCSLCGTRLPAAKNSYSLNEQAEYDEWAEAIGHDEMKGLGLAYCPVCGTEL